LVIDRHLIQKAREGLPELPAARRVRFESVYRLGGYDVEVLTSSPALADYFEGVARQHGDAKTAANWVMGEVLAALKNTGQEIAHFSVRPADLAALLNLVRDGVVSHTAGKQIFAEMVKASEPPPDIAKRLGLLKVSDDDALRRWLEEVVAENPKEAARFAAGEKKLQGVLIGAVMKKSKGSADPKRLAQLLTERFGT
jgi:aspartyl-tRNA(Asn)/glutamyl-tRNA(Gln) amidotransferase subunit B